MADNNDASGEEPIERHQARRPYTYVFVDPELIRKRVNRVEPDEPDDIFEYPRTVAEWREHWTSRIKARWQDSVEAILDVGKMINAARRGPNKLPHGEYTDMVENDLPFGPETARQLGVIARHPILSNPKFVGDLPPSWGALYEMTRLPIDELRELLKDKVFTPKTTRAEVKNWRTLRLDIVATCLDALYQAARKYKNPPDELAEVVIRHKTYSPHSISALQTWLPRLRDTIERVEVALMDKRARELEEEAAELRRKREEDDERWRRARECQLREEREKEEQRQLKEFRDGVIPGAEAAEEAARNAARLTEEERETQKAEAEEKQEARTQRQAKEDAKKAEKEAEDE